MIDIYCQWIFDLWRICLSVYLIRGKKNHLVKNRYNILSFITNKIKFWFYSHSFTVIRNFGAHMWRGNWRKLDESEASNDYTFGNPDSYKSTKLYRLHSIYLNDLEIWRFSAIFQYDPARYPIASHMRDTKDRSVYIRERERSRCNALLPEPLLYYMTILRTFLAGNNAP